MSLSPLPTALEDRLAALVERVRRVRIIRGASWLAIASVASAVAIVWLDAALELSVAVRCGLEAAWLLLIGMLAWRFVGRPWQAEVPLEEVARLVEAHFPALRERLLTAVRLGDESDPANASPRLTAVLARDTEQRTQGLDFARAVPMRPAVWLATATSIMLVAATIAVAATPGAREAFRRVAMPWYRTTVVVPFEIVVASGDPVVRRGDPVTLAAYLRPTDPNAILPDAATLVYRDGPGESEQRLPMIGDGAAAFFATRPDATADFEYRVEVGPAASDWHTVRIADPVELAEPSTIEIVPPPYAASLATHTLAVVTDFAASHFSTASFRLRFNRQAESAHLDWRPEGRPPSEPSDVIPMPLAPDGFGGTGAFRIPGNGTLRVVLINETGARKYRTEVPVAVRAIPDAPPRFEQITGVSAQPRTARLGDRIAIAFAAVDDIGVSAAEFEYALGPDGSESILVPIALTGAGTTRAEGRYLFDLAGKGRDGDAVRYRVRIADNRRVDDAKLGPQFAVHPPSGWAEVRLAASAPPLDDQEIFGQRDALRGVLSAALVEVTEAQKETATLRTDTAGRSPLPVDHAVRLKSVRDRIQKASTSLRDATRDAELTIELRGLAAAIRAVSDGPFRAADDALRTASTDNADERATLLSAAGTRLTEAVARIEELGQRNERLARDRLDRRRLEALAADQERIAARAKPREELLKAERELHDRLNQLLVESEPLRRGVAAVASRERAKLAEDAKALAAHVRELDLAAGRLHTNVRRRLLDALVRTQSGFEPQATGVLAQSETPARLAGIAPPKVADFRRAADLLAQDKLIDALTELEKLAQSLDRTAGEFEKWAAERSDAKLAARQLAKWQDDLHGRFRAMPFDKLPDAAKATLRLEQNALLRATERLLLPPDADLAALRDSAVIHLRMAGKRLDGDGAGAETARKNAVETLTRLADKAPTVAERLARSRPELDKLGQEQDAIATAVEPILRQFDKVPSPAVVQALIAKFAPLQARQQKLLDRLTALDLPGLESRQTRVAASMKAAAADLRAGLPFDSVASQAGAKRELERLRQAADRQPPADDKAEALARKQAAVARMFAAAGDRPTVQQLEPILAFQLEVLTLIGSLAAPEAPALVNEARLAVQSAEKATRDGSKHDAIVRRAREAADALRSLADSLTGRESDLDRVKRLADNRKQAECVAKKLAGVPFNAMSSDQARYQLKCEAEELTFTRVGAAGQSAKKKAVDLVMRLQQKTDPDRQAADQKLLADALVELAETMAAVAELATKPATAAPVVDPADAFLPSQALAESLRGLAHHERELRERANNLNADLAARLKPSATNPIAAIEARQRGLAAAAGPGPASEAARLAADHLAVGDGRAAREAGQVAVLRLRQLAGKPARSLAEAQEAILGDLLPFADDASVAAAQQKSRHEALAKKAFELARLFDLAAKDAWPVERDGPAFVEAANAIRQAQRLLTDAAEKGAEGQPAAAAKLRSEAEKSLQQASGPPSAAPPDLGSLLTGEALVEAERAIRTAIAELAEKGDAPAAERALKRAAGALRRAVKTSPPP